MSEATIRYDGIKGKHLEGIGPRQRQIYHFIRENCPVRYSKIVRALMPPSPYYGTDAQRAQIPVRMLSNQGFDEQLKKLKVRGLVQSVSGVYTLVSCYDAESCVNKCPHDSPYDEFDGRSTDE